ncbi:MAG: polyprenyl synthetase family protein [Thermogutta sp.]|nr:polyprenyl synthetase family protein [Thermogutta sp.]
MTAGTVCWEDTQLHLEALKQTVDSALDEFTRLPEDCPSRLREAMRYSLLAEGKRLRPLLVLLAAEACGGRVSDALPAACAVEMIHAYSLIHDDLPAMDDDDLRRGRPACHRQFDEATAILAGDALLTLAFEVSAKHTSPRERAGECCALLAEAAGPCRMVGGQMDDILAERGGHSLELLERIHRRKTGALIEVSLVLGAVLAGADERQRRALAEYGRCLGLAFQITDDLLDVEGEEGRVGKRLGKDQDRRKLTFPGLLGIAESRRRAADAVEQACRAVEAFGADARHLKALARSIAERKR